MTPKYDNSEPATRRQRFVLGVHGYADEQTAGLTKFQASRLIAEAERARQERLYNWDAERRAKFPQINWMARLHDHQWEEHFRKLRERQKKWQDPPQDDETKPQ